MNRFVTLAIFLFVVVGGGMLIGVTNMPGEWHAALAKPAFNPPNWVFAPVWTLLYILIAIAGWRTFERNRSGGRMLLWGIQMLLNFLWPAIFFGLHMMALALVVILLLLAAIVAFIAVTWRDDRLSAWLFVPYAAWVAFASALNLAFLWLN